MPALANLYFKDLFTEISPGSAMGPALVGSATGTQSSSPIALTGSAAFMKLLFDLSFLAGSIAGSISMYLATATASGGSYTSVSATLVSMVTTLSLSALYNLKIDSRDVAFANLGTGTAAPAWCKVVVVVTGSAIDGALKVLGWEAPADPANIFQAQASPLTAYTAFY
jgi:hypothetical protein